MDAGCVFRRRCATLYDSAPSDPGLNLNLIVILIFQGTSGTRVRVRLRLRTSRNALIQWQWGTERCQARGRGWLRPRRARSPIERKAGLPSAAAPRRTCIAERCLIGTVALHPKRLLDDSVSV